MDPQPKPSGVRLAELMGALSIATDLGMGQPLEFALSACVLAVRLGEALRWSDEALREIYYQALLRYIGCNVETHILAAIVGDEAAGWTARGTYVERQSPLDEQALRHDFAEIDNGDNGQIVRLISRYIRQAHAGVSALAMVRELARGLSQLPALKKSFGAHCEVAQRLAQRFGFDGNVVYALGQLYERWDGKGAPNGLKGEAIAPAVLVVTLAQDALIFYRLGGADAALGVARERKGSAYAPHICECFARHATSLLSGLDEALAWDAVLDLEPGTRRLLSEDEFDNACRAMADFVDIKSPYTLSHSSGVAALAAGAARQYGLPSSDALTLLRAGLLHDLGRTGISIGIWDKPAPLSEREWERVRLHAYYSERILARPPALARLGALAATHHERLDGSGYHRALPASLLSPGARILAAADAFHALTEARAHRAAFPPEAAAEQLGREAKAGRLDGDAVRSVLAAAGQRVPPTERRHIAGLSEREVEVLRLLARGLNMRQIAERLVISRKTVDSHIQHIYAKLDVSTRAGATMFAMEHQLLGDG